MPRRSRANSYESEPGMADRIAKSGKFDDWQVVVIHDDVEYRPLGRQIPVGDVDEI